MRYAFDCLFERSDVSTVMASLQSALSSRLAFSSIAFTDTALQFELTYTESE